MSSTFKGRRETAGSNSFIEIRGSDDFENAFRSAARGGAGAVLLQDDPLLRTVGTQIADLAMKHRLPVSTGVSEVADSGALMAYGPDRVDLYRRAARFVDRILKGANLPSYRSNRRRSSTLS